MFQELFQLQQEARFSFESSSNDNNNKTIASFLEDKSYINYFLNINIDENQLQLREANDSQLKCNQQEPEDSQDQKKEKKKKIVFDSRSGSNLDIQQQNFCWIDSRLKDVWPHVILERFISSLDDLKSIRLVCTQFRNFIDSLRNIHFQFKITDKITVQYNFILSSFKQLPKISSFDLSPGVINPATCLKLISLIPDYATNITIRNLHDEMYRRDWDISEVFYEYVYLQQQTLGM